MTYAAPIYWLGLLSLPAAVLVVVHVTRGLNRGWFRRRDGISRIKRKVSPAIFWFEVFASLGLAMALAWIGVLAAANLIGAHT